MSSLSTSSSALGASSLGASSSALGVSSLGASSSALGVSSLGVSSSALGASSSVVFCFLAAGAPSTFVSWSLGSEFSSPDPPLRRFERLELPAVGVGETRGGCYEQGGRYLQREKPWRS